MRTVRADSPEYRRTRPPARRRGRDGSSSRARRALGCGAVFASLLAGPAAGQSRPVATAAPATLTPEVARELVLELMPEVERLRGLSFKTPVPVEVVGEAAARAYMEERIRAFQREEPLRLLGQAYALLQLLPPGSDPLELILGAMQEQAGGFYDPTAKAYYLLDHVPAAAAPVFTVHELTHALEDQHFDLDARLRQVLDSEDASFARGAVHEGSATLVMSLHMSAAIASGRIDPAELRALGEAQARSTRALAELPPVLVRQLLGPYVLGASFLASAELQREHFPVQAVNRAYADGPVSSEQILHPEKFWDADRRDLPQPVELNDAGALLGRGFRLRAHGVLGELTLAALVGGAAPTGRLDLGRPDPASWTDEAAAGWDGDRWELWTRRSAAVVLLSTVWDSPEDAAQFAEALPRDAALARERAAERVAIVAGDARSKHRRVLARMLGADGRAAGGASGTALVAAGESR